MDLESLAKELHGERPDEKNFNDQDTYSEGQSNNRN
jgi:hypothetical protein